MPCILLQVIGQAQWFVTLMVVTRHLFIVGFWIMAMLQNIVKFFNFSWETYFSTEFISIDNFCVIKCISQLFGVSRGTNDFSDAKSYLTDLRSCLSVLVVVLIIVFMSISMNCNIYFLLAWWSWNLMDSCFLASIRKHCRNNVYREHARINVYAFEPEQG